MVRLVFLLSLLFIIVVLLLPRAVLYFSGNNGYGGSGESVPPSESVQQQYVKLQEKRRTLEEKINKMMDLYLQFKQKTKQQQIQLKELLGTFPFEEAVKLFRGGEVPENMKPAASCWRILLPDEVAMLKIYDWIESQQKSDLLTELEAKTKEVKNYIDVGKLLSDDDQKEIDCILITPLPRDDWNKPGNDLLYEEQAIENITNEMRKP
jgi:hypothetical protein